MGFLSGVLEAVKDDEAVKTYVINVDEFVEKIKKYVGNGHKGLVEVMKLVSSLLSGWEHFFDERTKEVKMPLENLEQRIAEHQNDIQKEKSNSLDKQFKDWARRSKEYLDKVEEAEEAMPNLDCDLRKRLETPMKLIQQAVKCFRTSCENKDLDALNKAARTELSMLKQGVNENVKKIITSMESNLKNRFESEIQTPISKIKLELHGINNILIRWIATAEHLVTDALVTVEKVLGKFDTKNISGTKYQTVEYAAVRLKQSADTLWKSVQQAKKGLRGLNGIISEAVIALEKLYTKKIQDVVSNVVNDVDEALSGISKVDEAVRKGVVNLRDAIVKQGIHKFVNKFSVGTFGGIADAATTNWSPVVVLP
ncbi:hypothetical protein, conserved [Babesia bigemina]|uniref:Uncharacterized protein n=1 Tax=Babesia bigemina TaxID=5866 RepID=A0A061BKR8_BABBI|nr:hypothetical protein, conserved [Babesia bigemina]CDR71525.1 hypothetical protein, conserved [Babesia bigemina]|eukprot:XP_012770471.1 hypothetical protein, conserved [Babesia bigemina]